MSSKSKEIKAERIRLLEITKAERTRLETEAKQSDLLFAQGQGLSKKLLIFVWVFRVVFIVIDAVFNRISYTDLSLVTIITQGVISALLMAGVLYLLHRGTKSIAFFFIFAAVLNLVMAVVNNINMFNNGMTYSMLPSINLAYMFAVVVINVFVPILLVIYIFNPKTKRYLYKTIQINAQIKQLASNK